MKKSLLFIVFSFLLNAAFAQVPADSIHKLDEVFIIAAKEQSPVERLPISHTNLSHKKIDRLGITSTNDLSTIVPNFYMPDYGSKLTSAIYIRGIGSRMNESAVGLYVDNAPYLDKSSFDFDFYDIEKVEVLRGPQGTLYGRNAMGGIINIYTTSPLNRTGTQIKASYGSANTVNATLSHARKIGENLGISVGGSYNQTDGFFTNQHTGDPADAVKTGAARFRLDWKASEKLRLNYTLNGEYSEQDGYAYGLIDSAGKVQSPSHNDDAGYTRLLVNNGLFLQYTGNNFSISSSTAYQYFDDNMKLDQDFTPENLFTLGQKQKQNAITEEIIIKSKGEKNYQWLFGSFGFYKQLNTEAPVNLKSDFIEQNITSNFPTSPMAPNISLVTDSGVSTPATEFFIPSKFEAPSYGLAAFHQSTYNNFIINGLSITAGIRLDYEKVTLRYNSTSRVHTQMIMPAMMGGRTYWYSSAAEPLYDGKFSNDFFELLPKFAIQYAGANDAYKIYGTVSKGYTSGGYNTNLFADLVQDKLMPERNGTIITFKQPENSSDIENNIFYKPEYSWNYEIGGAASLFNKRLSIAASIFFIDTRNQQIALFVPSGYGRIMKNAGRSESYGGEISLQGRVENLTLSANYGYTHATFTKYQDSVIVATGSGNDTAQVDYKGNFVPFAPQHTLSLGAEYDFYFNSKVLDKLTITVSYTGCGKIYFTAANESVASQNFYNLLNAKVTLEKSIFKLGFWAKNLLDTDYKTFYFESMGNRFAQKGKPLQFGVDLSIKF